MRKASAIVLAALFIGGVMDPPLSFAGQSGHADRKDFAAIRKLAAEKNYWAVAKKSAEFLKKHPDSHLAPDVRLLRAEIETSPDEAVAQLRAIVTKYRRYNRRAYTQHRLCEIAYLQSQWEILVREAREGRHLGKSPYAGKFSFYLIIALIHTGDYAGAERECRFLIEENHDYRTMARSLLILSHILRLTSGFSREYIGTLRDIALGYGDSDAMQAVLYLLGEFYENRRMYDESYSAYYDLLSKYPGSPEAAEAARRVKGLMKHGPRRVPYLPGKMVLDATEKIDIHPETDISEEDHSSAFYSISVGPLASAREAAELKGLLKGFDFVKTVRLTKGYALYVGKGFDEGAALKLKVRLAEEYGINGRIVRISTDGERSYIYGE
ncbi:MAG: hypothetical protein KA369_12350 [Spirochaetes bacterium]|nr:hypothetical protein [Spirochaetota bacterium]